MSSRSRSRSPRRSHSRPRDRYDDRRYRDRGRDRHGDNRQEGGYRRRGGYSRDHGRDYGRDRDRDSMADDYPYRRRNEKKEGGSGRDGARERDMKADNYPYRRQANNGDRDREADSDLERRKNRNEDEERGRARGNTAYSKDLEDSDPRDKFSPKKHPDSPRDEDTQRDDPGLKPKKSSFRFKGDAPRRRSRSPRRSDASSANVGGLNFVGPSKPKKKEKLPANTRVSKPTVGEEPIIVVHINDRLGTKAAIPCLASDRIKEFKILVAARIGREPHEILLKRQGERPFKDQLSLEDYGINNGVQLDLEVDTGD